MVGRGAGGSDGPARRWSAWQRPVWRWLAWQRPKRRRPEQRSPARQRHGWPRRASRRAALALALLLVAAEAVRWASIHPRNDRQWISEQSMMPEARFAGSRVDVSGIRCFAWQSPWNFTPCWTQRSYDLDALRTVWFVLAPFGKQWRGPAHSFLSFGFADSSYLAISVEARKELGETYSVWKGLLKRFELLYVVADERDLITLRTCVHGNDVYVYPVCASPEKARALLVEMLQRASALRERPEFYNTLTSNCTTNLLRHVNRVATRKLRGGWRVLLPGYSDQLAFEQGLIDTNLPLGQARERFRVNGRVARCLDDAHFSSCIRQADAP